MVNLWVDPPALRRGIGRALFEHARDRATRVGTVPAPVAGQRRELPRLYLRLTGDGG